MPRLIPGLIFIAFVVCSLSAPGAGVVWTGAVDTNWSNGGNWSGGTGTGGVPSAADNVVFGVAGEATTATQISNYLDSVSGNFGGVIASLQYTNPASFQNTVIAPTLTLNVTGATAAVSGLTAAGNAFMVGKGNTGGAVSATIAGPGAVLNVSNSAAEFLVSQGGGTAALAMTNLDTFTAYVSRFGVGIPPNYGWNVLQQADNGTLQLARTNLIAVYFSLPSAATNYTNWSGYNFASGHEIQEAIEIGNGADNSIGSASTLYLGETNAFFIDSIGVGKSKSTGGHALLAFNPVFTNANPTAVFRGTNGSSSRVTFFSIGDNVTGGSTSSGAFGTVDFSFGSIDALVEQMFLGIDKLANTSSTTPNTGTLNFTFGTVNVNGLTMGAQESPTAANNAPCIGVVNINGSGNPSPTNAMLIVNSTLELGHTATATTGTAAAGTYGSLNATNATVLANNIIVGKFTTTTNNAINLTSSTLIVTNTLATNALGLATFATTNSVIGLTVNSSASLVGLVQSLKPGGTTNLIQLAPVPVFATYPMQIPLIQYTTLNGTLNFGLTNVPASAPGAYLTNLTGPNSIALYLPLSPAPVITGPPAPVSGSPGDNVTFSVTNTGNPTLVYQWYEIDGGLTNMLVDGPTGTGSTNSGSMTSSLTILNAQTADSGGYFVVITNTYGAAASSAAQLTISSGAVAPSITGPTNQTVITGQAATISASVSGSPLPTLQWQFMGNSISDGPTGNGDVIYGSATSSLTVSNAQYPSSQGQYSIVASNSAGVVTNSMTLTVIVIPSISAQPTNLVVTNSQGAAFSVTAAGVPAPTYQWNKNAVAISSAINSTSTNATFVIASTQPSDIGTYSVTVSNAAGTISSTNVTLIVNSTMTTTTFAPANGATGICYDTPLYVTFDRPPTLNNLGKIRIYNAASATVVDTLDLSQGSPQNRAVGGVGLNTYPVIITGNTAAIYPHSGVMTSNQSYYVTIDDGVFTDSVGAYFAGISSSNVWQFTTRPTGPANPASLIVAADGSGDFVTVQGAADFVPNGNSNHVVINIRTGFYTEVVRLNSKSNVTFIGQDRQQTIVGYPNNNNINPGSSTRPMFGVIGGSDVAIENLTLTNSTPHGGSQAEALFVNNSRRFIFYNANLASFQDTLLVNASGDQAYLQDDHVQGDTDYIWGSGTIYATNCQLMAMSPQSHLTQARTPQGSNGFAFVNCRIIGASGAVNSDLGRDAANSGNGNNFYGQTAYINCTMDTNIIIPAGWVLGSGTVVGNTGNLRFWEYESADTNGNFVDTSQRVAWSTELDGGTATNQVQNVTNWFSGWLPQLAPAILTQPAGQSLAGGGTLSLGVGATGIPAPAYQWLKNGTNIPNATNSTFTVGAAYAGDAGSYSVIVSNAGGSIASGNAAVTVSNTAPTLNPISDQSINPGANLSIAGVASDPDVPPQSLSFGLAAGPRNAAVDSSSGAITWRPAVAQANTTNLFTVTVTDDGTPNLSASQSFNVIVNPLTNATLTSPSLDNGQFSLTVSGGTAGPDYILQVSTNLTSWQPIQTNFSPVLPFTFTDMNASLFPIQFYRVQPSP
jgi:hypothetical protein